MISNATSYRYVSTEPRFVEVISNSIMIYSNSFAAAMHRKSELLPPCKYEVNYLDNTKSNDTIITKSMVGDRPGALLKTGSSQI
jgi:hypothetical protein